MVSQRIPSASQPQFATCEVHSQAALAPLTTFRVGGPAEWLAMPTTPEAAVECLNWAIAAAQPITVLGAGSNLLISDQGLAGLVLCTKHLRGAQFDPHSGRVTVSAGEPLPKLAWQAARLGWSGLEWAVGIPGSVGGAVVMNAGAQGGCTADILQQVTVASSTGVQKVTPADLGYAYRTSSLQRGDRYALSACFQLEPGHDPEKLLKVTTENLNSRKRTQPYHLPNCGSVFRNPTPYKAGWLIEQLGLKGFQLGQAQIAEMHANFILNLGGAQASDILRLIQHVQAAVAERWALEMEPEVRILGSFESLSPAWV
jgi:UDP-N-acetylmuramate dehydrogenase